MLRILRAAAAALATALVSTALGAQPAPSDDAQRLLRNMSREDAAAVMDLARQARTPITSVVPIGGGQATLTVPAELFFIPGRVAEAIVRATGAQIPGFKVDGAVMPRERAGGWVVLMQWVPSGHVADRAARQWKADELLARVREQAKAEAGGREVDIRSWLVPPVYNAAAHTLVYGLVAPVHELGPLVPRRALVHGVALGREGHLRMVLVTSEPEVAQHKPVLLNLLDSTIFEPGKRYDEFKPGTDRAWDRSITALILGKDPEPRSRTEALGQWARSHVGWLFAAGVAVVALLLGVLLLRTRAPVPR